MKDKLKSDILLWTPTHGHTSVDWSAKTYQEQVLIGMDGVREGVKGIHAVSKP